MPKQLMTTKLLVFSFLIGIIHYSYAQEIVSLNDKPALVSQDKIICVSDFDSIIVDKETFYDLSLRLKRSGKVAQFEIKAGGWMSSGWEEDKTESITLWN